MDNSLRNLLACVLLCTICSIGRAHYVHLDSSWNDDLVYEREIGEELQLPCRSSARNIEFHIAGIRGKIENGSDHSSLFPGSDPIISELSEDYDNYRQKAFLKTLILTVVPELNNAVVQCGAKEYNSTSRRLIWVYSLGLLLRVSVGDDSENSTNTATPPYVDITFVDGGELRIGGKLHIECNSSSDQITFCVIGAPCESEYSLGLPNGSNPSVSDTMVYYSNEKTLYWRALELSVVAELHNIAFQCKAGKDVQSYTSGVLLKVEDDTILPTPTGLTVCPSPSETVQPNETEYVCCGGWSASLKWEFKLTLVLAALLTTICRM